MCAMITATKIQALAVPLAIGGEAVLVQDGPAWENLHKFRCISPPSLSGKVIIAAKEQIDSQLSAMFGELFHVDGGDKMVVVMASPELAKQIKPAGA